MTIAGLLVGKVWIVPLHGHAVGHNLKAVEFMKRGVATFFGHHVEIEKVLIVFLSSLQQLRGDASVPVGRTDEQVVKEGCHAASVNATHQSHQVVSVPIRFLWYRRNSVSVRFPDK